MRSTIQSINGQNSKLPNLISPSLPYSIIFIYPPYTYPTQGYYKRRRRRRRRTTVIKSNNPHLAAGEKTVESSLAGPVLWGAKQTVQQCCKVATLCASLRMPRQLIHWSLVTWSDTFAHQPHVVYPGIDPVKRSQHLEIDRYGRTKSDNYGQLMGGNPSKMIFYKCFSDLGLSSIFYIPYVFRCFTPRPLIW